MGPRRSALRWTALLSLAAAALQGCAHAPPADLSRDPAALLEQVRQAQARVQRVRGTARLRIDSPSLSGTLLEFIAAEKPDRVHLETLDFFGNPAAVMVASGGRFGFFDARANVFYRGDATPENVSRLLPVVLPLDELVTILCGSAPLLQGKPLEVAVDGDELLLTIGRGEIGQRLTIGDEAAVVESRIRRAAGAGQPSENPAYDLTLSDFHRKSGVRFPNRTRLDAPGAKSRVDLTWREDLEVGSGLDAALFRLEPPRGARVVELAHGEPVPAPSLPIQPEPKPQ
jgi:hypothetical protein